MLQAQHRQGVPSPTEHLAQALKLPNFCNAPSAHLAAAQDMARVAAGPVSAITQYTGHSPSYEPTPGSHTVTWY